MTVAIELAGLTKTYGLTRAVSDLSLRVEAGQVFGFLGPNGAGKTTTIRILLALQRPTRGQATVLGLDSQRDSVEIHRRIGYLPGELELYPRMTGKQHIDSFARARGHHDRRSRTTLSNASASPSIVLRQELSKGNRQKVGLVLAFMHAPELLILDEPTSGLDPLVQNEFERLVREIVSEGRTVFLSSHELDEVQRVADRVGLIRSGSLITTDTVDHLRQSAPRTIEARFHGAVDRAVFSGIGGVTVTACEGARVSLQLTGAIGPVLRVIADHDPVDVISRHADLDELFLELYREPPAREAPHD